MAITAIGRYFVGDPNIVAIVTTDNLATITTAGYLTAQAANIELIQNGDFEWSATDLVLIYYSAAQIGFFTYDATNATFVALAAPSGLANTLASGNIFVGNVSNVATGVAMSGDGTISNAGVFAISPGVIINSDINAAAAIAFSKLASLTSGNLLVGSAGNVPTAVAMSGDATMVASGALTIAANAITTAKILNANVTLAKLAAGITPAYVIKLGGKDVSAGGSATVTITATGVVAGDLAFAAIQASVNPVSIQKVTAGTDQIVVLCSADPGAATICWQADRAAS